MIALTLAEVAAAVGGEVLGDPTLVVDAVATDSRALPARALFVALRGAHADGHRFVEAARDGGAVACLVERQGVEAGHVLGPAVVVDDTWWAVGALGAAVRDRVDPAVVAITGSVGKTTTKDLIAAALGADRPTVAAEGSFNNELGVPLTLLATEQDTRALVVEIGARGQGHIASLTPWVRPDVAVVTRVAGAHLEMFRDLDGVAVAKGELVEALPADGTAVLNAADPRVRAMAARTNAPAVLYGDGAGAAVHVLRTAPDGRGRHVAQVATPWGDVELRVPLPGAHNLDNALAAIAVAGSLGVPVDVAAHGIAGATVSRWRGELHDRPDGLLVVNDAYNANPTSVLAALDTLLDLRRARPSGRAVAVLGFMAELGAGEADGHEQVGDRAGTLADLVVAVGHTGPLADRARAAGAEVVEVATADDAVAALRGRVGPDDVVLVKASRSAGLEVVATGVLADDTPRDGTRRPSRTDAPSVGTPMETDL